MITGNCEPQQNLSFLKAFGDMIATMKNPFRWVEIQTTGVFLDNQKLRFLRNHVGVSTISVSTFSFDDTKNAEYLGNEAVNVRLKELCDAIKLYDFNLRLSVNLVDSFMEFAPEEILAKCKSLLADQVTFRHLYDDGSDSDQAMWTRAHRTSDEYEENLDEFLKKDPRLGPSSTVPKSSLTTEWR
jgi:sulfatase maturation enzyme AslB (radical SAM superfamily)